MAEKKRLIIGEFIILLCHNPDNQKNPKIHPYLLREYPVIFMKNYYYNQHLNTKWMYQSIYYNMNIENKNAWIMMYIMFPLFFFWVLRVLDKEVSIFG